MERGVGRVYRIFFLISCIAVNITAGCVPPIGNIGGSGGADDLFWVVPNRVVYDQNDYLLRNSDLKVFTSYRGAVESIPVDQVKIGISEKPDLAPDSLVYMDEIYPLTIKGRKLVVVEYDNMKDEYSIEVRDLGLGGGNGNGPGEGSGIEIEWVIPVERY